MYLAVSSIGSCLFLSTCYILVHPVSPVPVLSLTYVHRSIHGLPVVRRAFSVIAPSGGEDLDTVHGEIFLEETNEGVFITGTIHGLKPGRHGFHVHQEGDLGNSCKASGGHYNPAGNNHSAPTSSKRHVGDLGNVITNRFGRTNVNIFDKVITLDPASENSVANRAFVVHLGEDDLGIPGLRDGDGGSLKTGNAGSRVACGIITPNPSK